jgi:alpha,alpha-trehalase
MRLFFLLWLALAGSAGSIAQAPQPSPGATLNYIHGAWETLTRSVADCHSLVDVKVTAEPVLYLPADFAAPPELAGVEQKCHAKITALPRRIEKIGDLRPGELPAEGLLFLPNPYIVPGGRFNLNYA